MSSFICLSSAHLAQSSGFCAAPYAAPHPTICCVHVPHVLPTSCVQQHTPAAILPWYLVVGWLHMHASVTVGCASPPQSQTSTTGLQAQILVIWTTGSPEYFACCTQAGTNHVTRTWHGVFVVLTVCMLCCMVPCCQTCSPTQTWVACNF